MPRKLLLFLLLSLCALPATCQAAPARHSRSAPRAKLHVLRRIPTRVTLFYQFTGKDGKVTKMAAVTKTITVKVVK